MRNLFCIKTIGRKTVVERQSCLLKNGVYESFTATVPIEKIGLVENTGTEFVVYTTIQLCEGQAKILL